MISPDEKMSYNEKVKLTAKRVGEKLLADDATIFIAYYDKAMYCRETSECQELTNAVFCLDFAVMFANTPFVNQFVDAEGHHMLMAVPCCEKHLSERIAFSKVVDQIPHQ